MQRKMRLLIIEDEAAIRSGLVDLFVYHGYEVAWSADGAEGLGMALSGRHDLVLLDLMLPGLDGYEICRRIRAADAEQPIIMLTAKGSDDEIVQGLSLGADDYVTKPFSVAQLVLRVQAVLRRSLASIELANTIDLGGEVALDCMNLTGTRAGSPLAFTRREMDVLQYLHANADRSVSRDELLNRVWGYARNLELETRTVDIHIAKLRRKIEEDPGNPRYLVTVRGRGYRLQSE